MSISKPFCRYGQNPARCRRRRNTLANFKIAKTMIPTLVFVVMLLNAFNNGLGLLQYTGRGNTTMALLRASLTALSTQPLVTADTAAAASVDTKPGNGNVIESVELDNAAHYLWCWRSFRVTCGALVNIAVSWRCLVTKAPRCGGWGPASSGAGYSCRRGC